VLDGPRADGDAFFAATPRPGRVVAFDGMIYHSVRCGSLRPLRFALVQIDSGA
jgi:hypothetical protein